MYNTQLTRKRQTNLELLRIVSMLMVVVLHYVQTSHGGAMNSVIKFSSNYYFTWYLKALSTVSVDCYVLISGYFLINSKFNLKKVILMWLQIWFYSVGMYLIFYGFGIINIDIKQILYCFFPVIENTYWFASIYIVLYIIFPFLNISIKALNRKEHKVLIIIMFFMLAIWPIFPNTDGLDANNGASIIQFIFLYIIASYIRLHYINKINRIFYIISYFFICTVMFISTVISNFLGLNLELVLYQYNSITVVLASVSLFLFFTEMKITNKIASKIIASISPLTFGVYLIHEQYIIRGNILWQDILKVNVFSQSQYFIPIAAISIIAVFGVSCCIDAVRVQIFKLFENSKWFNRFINKLSNIKIVDRPL